MRHVESIWLKVTLATNSDACTIGYNDVLIQNCLANGANLDPRSLRLNTEMGLLVESESLNAAIRAQVEPDFLPFNAWHLQFDESGDVIWVSDTMTLQSQPAANFMQRIEDWFFAHLPIEAEL